MNKYLEPTDADAYVDFPEFPNRETAARMNYTKLCPVCAGHGGWNLKLNAYPLHDYADTPENRHRYSHFICSCSHCNGWGYVPESEMCSGHEWERVRKVAMCLTIWRCTKCGKEEEVDSSD